MNDELRKKVKMLKVFQDIKYKEIAEYLEIRVNSLYNWLRGQYEFSDERLTRLAEIVNALSE